MTLDDLYSQTEAIRAEAEGLGFTIKYETGKVFYIYQVPNASGSNAELVQINAANTDRKNAWNAILANLWQLEASLRSGISTVTVIENPWGSAGKEVPAGYTINYGDLFQQYQIAVSQENWAQADQIAKFINAITDAGPVKGGYVPVTGTTPEGEAITPGPGIVYGPTGIVSVPPPTVSGSIPPGPSSPTGDGPTTMPIDPNITLLPATTASGGAGSSGSGIPQISPAGTPAPTTTPNNNTMILLLVAAVVVLYFVME
jgi:hypothetical protein